MSKLYTIPRLRGYRPLLKHHTRVLCPVPRSFELEGHVRDLPLFAFVILEALLKMMCRGSKPIPQNCTLGEVVSALRLRADTRALDVVI